MQNKKRRSLLSRISVASTRLFSSSVFARFLSRYEEQDARLSQGFLGNIRRFLSHRKAWILKLKTTFNRLIENSFFVKQKTKVIHAFLSLRLKSLGAFFLVFGLINCLIFLVERFLITPGSADPTNLIFGVVLAIASLPCFSRRRSLSSGVRKSLILGSFLENVVLLRPDQYPHTHSKSADALAVLFGVLLGVLSFFVNPFSILLFFCAIILASLSLYQPEFGASLLFFFYAFLPAEQIAMLTLFVCFCLLFKLLRGKRSLRFDLLSAFALLFFLYLALTALSTALPGKENAALLLISLLTFFLCANLSRRKEVFSVLLGAFATGASLQAALRLLFRFLPKTAVTGEVRAFAQMLSEHGSPAICVCAVTLSLFFLLRAGRAGTKLCAMLSLALLFANLWLYHSLMAWTAAVLGALLLLALSSRALFFSTAAFALCTLIALPLIEGQQLAFLLQALEDRAPDLLFSRSQLPPGSFVLGLGAFSPDALAGLQLSTEVYTRVTLYTQVLLCVGFVGLLFLILTPLNAARKCAHYYVSARHNPDRLLALAPMVCVFSLFVLGLTQNLMLDAHVFSLLFSLSAVSGAVVDTLKDSDNVILSRF